MTADVVPPGQDQVRLSPERISEAALELLDRAGPESLSMRALASELGVATMSLYNHVSGREEVVRNVAALLLGTIDLSSAASGPWRERLRAAAGAYRELALEHPGGFHFVLSHQYSVPTTLGPTTTLIAALRAGGVDDGEVVQVMRTFIALLGGLLARELGSPGETPTAAYLAWHVTAAGGVDDGVGAGSGRATAPPPLVMPELAHALTTVDHATEFQFSVELLLDAIERRSSTRNGSLGGVRPDATEQQSERDDGG